MGLENIIIYIVCVGFSIISAYKLGFNLGEDKGRKDMQNFMTGKDRRQE